MKKMILSTLLITYASIVTAQVPSVPPTPSVPPVPATPPVPPTPPAEQFVLNQSDLGNFSVVQKRNKLESGATVEIENIAGRVQVIGWDKNSIEINARLGEHVDRLDFSVKNDKAKIHVIVPKGIKRKSKKQAELIVWVPNNCALEIEGISTQVEVSAMQEALGVDIETVSGATLLNNVAGSLIIESVSGAITVVGTDSHVEVETISGRVSIDGSPNSIDIETVSGRIDVKGVREKVVVETVSGKVGIQAAGVSELNSSSHSGTVIIGGHLAKNADVDIETFSGSISLVLETTFAGEYNLSTFSGITQVNFPDKQYGPSKRQQFTYGDAKGEIKVETFSGKINIENK